jgi:hypothetical protein
MHSDSRFSQPKVPVPVVPVPQQFPDLLAVPTVCMVPYVMYGTVSDTIYFICNAGLYIFQYKIKKFLYG